jgi:ABC-type uncharacterized transport system permease subunit
MLFARGVAFRSAFSELRAQGGVATALVAMALAYFTNYFMASYESAKTRTWEHPYIEETARSKRMRRANISFHTAAFLAAFASLFLFVIGMFSASDRITVLLAN